MLRLIDLDDTRRNNLDFMRFVAASVVIYAHAYDLSGRTDPISGITGLSTGLLAVAVFFCLSGFLIAKSLLNRGSIIHFAVARALRIYPGIIVANILTVLFVAVFVTTLPITDFFNHIETWKYCAMNSSLVEIYYHLPGAFVDNPYPRAVNGSLWSLKFEMFMYAITFLAGLVGFAIGGKGRRRERTVACLAVLFGGLFIGIQGWIPGVPCIAASPGGLAMSCFSAGTLLFLARSWIPIHGFGAVAAIAGITATVGTAFEGPTLALGLAYTCLWLAFTPHLKAHDFGRNGDLSYGMYIYAFVVQQTLYLISPSMHPLVNFAGAFLVASLLAAFSWHCVERRALGARDAIVRCIARILGQDPSRPPEAVSV